jgi:hypothetical protein
MRRLRALVLIGAGLIATSALAAGKISPPGRQVDVNTPIYEFEYSYPAAAGRIPALKAWLDKDAAQKQADIAAGAREASADAKKDRNGFFSAYDSETDWQVVTELPGWLSLSGTVSDYSGGAHPNHGPVALLWDKTNNRKVDVASLFTSKAALTAAIRKPFCAELNRQRADKRGQDIDPKSTDPFDACIDPVGEAVILGSADHAHFTRIGVLIGPYEAGPYTEGDYEVTLPVTPQVLSAVRPEYRAAFALGR